MLIRNPIPSNGNINNNKYNPSYKANLKRLAVESICKENMEDTRCTGKRR